MQERRNYFANALELRISCTNPSIYNPINMHTVSLCFALFCLHGCYAWIHMNCHSLHALHWRHNDQDGVSNHQPHDCSLNLLFRRRPKKTSKLRVTGLCVGNSPGPVNSPHKGPVTRKMFPLDDVIMGSFHVSLCYHYPSTSKRTQKKTDKIECYRTMYNRTQQSANVCLILVVGGRWYNKAFEFEFIFLGCTLRPSFGILQFWYKIVNLILRFLFIVVAIPYSCINVSLVVHVEVSRLCVWSSRCFLY